VNTQPGTYAVTVIPCLYRSNESPGCPVCLHMHGM
jgi:hypothetical protein